MVKRDQVRTTRAPVAVTAARRVHHNTIALPKPGDDLRRDRLGRSVRADDDRMGACAVATTQDALGTAEMPLAAMRETDFPCHHLVLADGAETAAVLAAAAGIGGEGDAVEADERL